MADTEFEVSHEGDPGDILYIGLSEFGMAGLTAINHVKDALGLEETGHISAPGLVSITSFEEGKPRHHTRFFSGDNYSLLVGELFIPPFATTAFSKSVLEWCRENEVEEIVFLTGIPVQHSEAEHDAYYVASDDFREARLNDADVEPMGVGFLQGVYADILQDGMDTPLKVGVFITPVHNVVQDIDASLRLLTTLQNLYGLETDKSELEKHAREVNDYYSRLSHHVQEREQDETKFYDRAFM